MAVITRALVIRAVQYTGSNSAEVLALLGGNQTTVPVTIAPAQPGAYAAAGRRSR